MKNEIMIFEQNEVEIIELNGEVLFNPRHVGKCLDITNSTVRDHISKMSDKQVKKLTNSDVASIDFRKLHNTGESFLTEAGVYKLIFRSRKPEAEKFQDWVTDVVLPSIRKTGSYSEKELSPAEFLLHQAQRMVDQERKMKQIETEQKKQSLELEEIKAKVTTTNSDFYTVSGFAAIRNLRHLDVNKANLLGRLASKLSRHYGIDIGKVKDERYGSVNTYHIDVLTEAFRSFQREQKGRLLL